MAAMNAARTAPPIVVHGQPGPERFVEAETATNSSDCMVRCLRDRAEYIATGLAGSHQLAAAVIAECLVDLDPVHARGDPPAQPAA